MQKEFDDYKADFASKVHEKELELSRFAEEIKKLRQKQSMSATEIKEMVALANEENRNKTELLSNTINLLD
jgi:predicted RNase H-like nuclease